LKAALARFTKGVLFNSPLRRYAFPRYAYMFTPPQLIFLCQTLESTREVEGQIAEVGCSEGSTTVFLNRHMDAIGLDKPYVALDTFQGFTRDDISFEVSTRGKSADFYNGFQANSQRWFDATMRQNAITRVRTIKADVSQYALRQLGPFSFVLLDVDLYRPIEKALPELSGALSPGGVIVVDDCNEKDPLWDGADQAYKEFMRRLGKEPDIVLGKLGIVRK
jgi:O-methyltransferase